MAKYKVRQLVLCGADKVKITEVFPANEISPTRYIVEYVSDNTPTTVQEHELRPIPDVPSGHKLCTHCDAVYPKSETHSCLTRKRYSVVFGRRGSPFINLTPLTNDREAVVNVDPTSKAGWIVGSVAHMREYIYRPDGSHFSSKDIMYWEDGGWHSFPHEEPRRQSPLARRMVLNQDFYLAGRYGAERYDQGILPVWYPQKTIEKGTEFSEVRGGRSMNIPGMADDIPIMICYRETSEPTNDLIGTGEIVAIPTLFLEEVS